MKSSGRLAGWAMLTFPVSILIGKVQNAVNDGAH
jgi:hypothetical protein